MRFEGWSDVNNYLDSLPSFKKSGAEGAHFGLEPMRAFCSAMGDPQQSLEIIHVAGTNGKGTTCRFISSVYQSAGYRCGAFLSPHLVDFRERFTINGEWIDKADVVEFFNRHHGDIEKHRLSYFEICTGLAFWWFRREKVDLAVLETGLGGRLDATNVVDPLVSVITSIGYDHRDLLGETLKEISREKAGIIKPGKPVVIGNIQPEAREEIDIIAEKQDSPVYYAESLEPDFNNGKVSLKSQNEQYVFESGFANPVNAWNVAMTWIVSRLLNKPFPCSVSAFSEGTGTVAGRFPRSGCFERIHPEFHWYFDGAHNLEALSALKKMLARYQPVDEWTVVFTLMKDKVGPSLLNEFSEFKKKYYYSPEILRAATFEEVDEYFHSLLPFPKDESEVIETLKSLESEFVIFTGSLYCYETISGWLDNLYLD